MLHLILQISRGLIRDQQMRRQIMFYTLLVALVMLFLGSTVFFEMRHDHPLLFMSYWAACAWITILAMLLAIFDMLVLRLAARRARRRLEATFLEEEKDASSDNGPDPTRT